MKKYKRLEKDQPIVHHHGIFRRKLNLFGAVALMVSGTIGAGVLGIPYAVAKVGLGVGLLYIIGIGILMTGLNLLLGEVVIRTKQKFQLSGLANRYLGKVGEWVMTFIVYSALFGILVVYIIGEGETLSTLFGSTPLVWSLVFFFVASIIIMRGIRTIKTVELFLTLGILAIIVLIAVFSTPHISFDHLSYSNLAYLLFPYGVVLFAFHGTTAVPEAHAVLVNKNALFKKSLIIAGIVTTLSYCLFAIAVVGVTGAETTEIATIGLGNKLGSIMFVLGNVFAALAMGTSFIMAGLALRDSFNWDFHVNKRVSNLIVLGVPLIIFLFGIREFIKAIDFVGGVLGSLEMLLIIAIYWRAKQTGDVSPGKYKLHHTVLLVALLIIALTFGAVYSIIKLF